MLRKFMKSGYKILWTDHAISELNETIEYLEKNWTEKKSRKFSTKLDHTIELISKHLTYFLIHLKKRESEKLLLKHIITCITELLGILSKFFLYFQTEKIQIGKKYNILQT